LPTNDTKNSNTRKWDNGKLWGWVAFAPAGARLANTARRVDVQLYVGRLKDMNESLDNVSGIFDHREGLIMISMDQKFGEAAAAFVHELEHARQFIDGEWKSPTSLPLEDYVSHRLQMERNAETKSNQVAFELSERNFKHLRQEKEAASFCFRAQAAAYFASRDRGETHEQARKASEHMWDASSARQDYLDQFTTEYQKAQEQKRKREAILSMTSSSRKSAKKRTQDIENEVSLGPTLEM